MKYEIDMKEVKRPIYIDVEIDAGLKELKIKELNMPVLIYDNKGNEYPRGKKLGDADLNTTIDNISKFIAETPIKLIPEENRETWVQKEHIFNRLRLTLRGDIVGEE